MRRARSALRRAAARTQRGQRPPRRARHAALRAGLLAWRRRAAEAARAGSPAPRGAAVVLRAPQKAAVRGPQRAPPARRWTPTAHAARVRRAVAHPRAIRRAGRMPDRSLQLRCPPPRGAGAAADASALSCGQASQPVAGCLLLLRRTGAARVTARTDVVAGRAASFLFMCARTRCARGWRHGDARGYTHGAKVPTPESPACCGRRAHLALLSAPQPPFPRGVRCAALLPVPHAVSERVARPRLRSSPRQLAPSSLGRERLPAPRADARLLTAPPRRGLRHLCVAR